MSAPPLDAFVLGIRDGTLVATPRTVRALIESGVSRDAILDALVAGASDPSASRRFHRALSVLRDHGG
jgi:hypothetical protein